MSRLSRLPVPLFSPKRHLSMILTLIAPALCLTYGAMAADGDPPFHGKDDTPRVNGLTTAGLLACAGTTPRKSAADMKDVAGTVPGFRSLWSRHGRSKTTWIIG